ncbi:T9SS type A sorting domain-containing protein [Mesoflavibacter zeaxanthinifaciens]|uniref:T9SS type A sorting domain-containing protein n=1 Tax=Mesoflavibacter zeaxanthinifaciens TaxID=393060 RepID=UPI003A958A00
MKRILLFVFALLLSVSIQAQFNESAPWMKMLNTSNRSSDNPLKFQQIVDAFNNYWLTHDKDQKGSGYKPFKRWEAYWSNFVKEDGTLPTSEELWDTYQLVQNQSQNLRSSNVLIDESNWMPIGPFTHTNTGSWSSGQGRVNVIVKDPNNPSTFYVGAPAGGIWKSTDAGLTWNTTTDNLPQIGVSGIAVDVNNSNIIYIATGDDDAGDSYSVGVMKSTDGGQTWNTTGLNPGNSPSSMNDIYMHPSNSNILWVATNSGVFKTTDAGVSWSNQNSLGGSNGTAGLNIKDIKIHPTNPDIIYAASSSRIYKSTNGGESFSLVSSGLPNNGVSRYVIDVTPANPNVVYALAADNSYNFLGLYKSSDSANSFTNVASSLTVGDIFESPQAWYDMAMTVSDTNENEVYTGVLNIWKTTDSGTTFTKINNWSSPFSSSYTHADIHFLRFFDGELFAGTDGGFYKSSNGGTSFTDLTAGMQISQFYRISVSKQSSSKMVGGLQDNGGHAFSNGQWQNYYGADGMDTAIDPNNSNLYYGFTQNGGGLYYSTNAGASLTGNVSAPAGENGNWITPLAMSANGELFSGYNSLYKLQGGSWVAVSPSFGTNIDVLEIDEINPNNIYVGTNSSLYKSTDNGATFNFTYSFSSNITSIEVNNTDNNIIYVTTSGVAGQVYKSVDGGINFTSISTGLPNVTKNSIKHQALHTKNPLFLGTSLGVYRYDDDTLMWELFNNNLPNVSVRDIEINLIDNNITAATYGRGIWQSSISYELPQDDVKLVSVSGIGQTIECNANLAPQVELFNNGQNTITSIDLTYNIDGTPNMFTWTGTLASETSVTVTLPSFTLSKGTHSFNVSSTINNDAFAENNNSETSYIKANASGATLVVNTFETPEEVLLVYDEGTTNQYWQRGLANGTTLNSSVNSTNVYGTNLNGDYADNTKSYLVSECFDLTTVSSPTLEFDMAFELEQDWDIVYVEYSLDQGATWSLLGSSTDVNWYNNGLTSGENGTCYNCPGGQWTGENTTMTHYTYNLSAFGTETNFMYRFVFHSDQVVNEEGVIIDNPIISGISLSTETFNSETFKVYPNPSTGIFNLKTDSVQQLSISVIDVTGKEIFNQQNVNIQDNNYKIDLSDYSSGIYVLSIKTSTTTTIKKLIVK